MSLLHHAHSKWLLIVIIVLLALLMCFYPINVKSATWNLAYEAPGQVQSQPQEMTSRRNQELDRARSEQRNFIPGTTWNGNSGYHEMLRVQRDVDEAQKDLSDSEKRAYWRRTQDEMNQGELNNPNFKNHFEVVIPPLRHYNQSKLTGDDENDDD